MIFLILSIQLKKFIIWSTGSIRAIYGDLRRTCCLTKNVVIETDKKQTKKPNNNKKKNQKTVLKAKIKRIIVKMI